MLGLWPAPSVAREKYGAECPWREIRWCLRGSKGSIWPWLFSHRYYHNPLPNYKELWHGRICQTGVHEGLPVLVLKIFMFISYLWFSIIYFFFCWYNRKLVLPTWGSVMGLVHISSYVVCWQNSHWFEKRLRQHDETGTELLVNCADG